MTTASTTLSTRARPLGKYPHLKRVGDFAFLSGVSARLPDGTIAGTVIDAEGVRRHDAEVQTRTIFGNIEETLREIGGSLTDCVDVVVFLTSMESFAVYNQVYGEFFDISGPARTTVGVRELPHPDMVVEMKVQAYVRSSAAS